jgi:hypothetical protein
MNRERNASLAVSSDTQTLYQLGLAQEINGSVCRLLRAPLFIVIVAFFFRCLISYGEVSEHFGPGMVHN